MDIMAMTAQLAEGFLVTVQIFVLTLLFSLPHVGGIWAHVQMQNNKADCKALHLCYEGNTVDAADYRSIFCTILYVSYEDGTWLPFSGSYNRVCYQLCSIFCRNLSFWYRIHSKWTVRGSTGAWLQQSADFHSHYSSAGN